MNERDLINGKLYTTMVLQFSAVISLDYEVTWSTKRARLKGHSGRYLFKKIFCETIVKQLWQYFRIFLLQFRFSSAKKS